MSIIVDDDADQSTSRAVLYASNGPELTQYHIDINAGTLLKGASIRLPDNIMYACFSVSGRYLYVGSSDWRLSGPNRATVHSGSNHYINVFRIDQNSGELYPHGNHARLRHRSNHMATDALSKHLLATSSNPSELTVHRINEDGSIGDEVKQAGSLDFGICGHHIRVSPSNHIAVFVTRGNDANRAKEEDPGALKVFKYEDGMLTNCVSVAPCGGYGFGPRNVEFHPNRPWMFVSVERQNKLHVYALEDGAVSAEPVFEKETLADLDNIKAGQMVGTLQVHPNGCFVYVANRAFATIETEGKRLFGGGENNIAVYAVNQTTGEPKLIQNIDTRGIYPRTFEIDPSGRLLIVANAMPLLVTDDRGSQLVHPSFAIFRIADDGRLAYARKYDIDTGGELMYWMGLVSLGQKST